MSPSTVTVPAYSVLLVDNPPPAGEAPGIATFRTPTTAITGAKTDHTLPIDKPSDLVDGDTLVVALVLGFMAGTSPATLTAPTGWTLIGTVQNWNQNIEAAWYRKVASGEPASWNWTWNADANAAAVCTAIAGLNSGDDGHSVQPHTTGTTDTTPTVTTTVDDVVLSFFGWADATALTTPSGTTRIDEADKSAINPVQCLLVWERQTTPGMTSARSTSKSTSINSIAGVMALPVAPIAGTNTDDTGRLASIEADTSATVTALHLNQLGLVTTLEADESVTADAMHRATGRLAPAEIGMTVAAAEQPAGVTHWLKRHRLRVGLRLGLN